MKKAKVLDQLETVRDRARALEATVARLEIERSTDRVELTVADATIDAARARIAMLERTCESLTQRIAMTERERDARLAQREPAPATAPDDGAAMERDRLIAALAEASRLRDAALVERDEVRAAAIAAAAATEAAEREREALIAGLELRLKSIAQARERLFDGNLRAADERIRLERLASERLDTIARLEAERAELHVSLESIRETLAQRVALERTEQQDALDGLDGRMAKLEYERDGAVLRLAEMKAEFDRLKARASERDRALESAEQRLACSGEIVQALTLAQRKSAESIATLQLECIRLEYDVASRVGAAEANAARARNDGSRLRDERTLLIETLALREKRIAVLEGTLRGIAYEMIRTAQAERDRYLALRRGLLASKIVAVRDALIALLGRPRALRAQLLGRAGRAPRKRRAALGRKKRPRHLRSA